MLLFEVFGLKTFFATNNTQHDMNTSVASFSQRPLKTMPLVRCWSPWWRYCGLNMMLKRWGRNRRRRNRQSIKIDLYSVIMDEEPAVHRRDIDCCNLLWIQFFTRKFDINCPFNDVDNWYPLRTGMFSVPMGSEHPLFSRKGQGTRSFLDGYLLIICVVSVGEM